MRIILTMTFLMIWAATQIFAAEKRMLDVPVEVIEIRYAGLSDADETKSVIEIFWRVNHTLHSEPDVFYLSLETHYADGAIVVFDTAVEGTSRSTKIEIPTLHVTRGRQPAFIKQLRALVTGGRYPAKNPQE